MGLIWLCYSTLGSEKIKLAWFKFKVNVLFNTQPVKTLTKPSEAYHYMYFNTYRFKAI